MADDRSIAIERIRHMLEAANAIAGYVARGREAYDADPAIRDAILYQIIVTGEAAKAVVQRDPALASELENIEWASAEPGEKE